MSSELGAAELREENSQIPKRIRSFPEVKRRLKNSSRRIQLLEAAIGIEPMNKGLDHSDQYAPTATEVNRAVNAALSQRIKRYMPLSSIAYSAQPLF